jgi:hypothetical protein
MYRCFSISAIAIPYDDVGDITAAVYFRMNLHKKSGEIN